jgi:mono/diheme cytochrome c family protein
MKTRIPIECANAARCVRVGWVIWMNAGRECRAREVKSAALVAALLLMGMPARVQAQEAEQIRKGADLYAVNCSPCHGPRMQGSESAFDLRKFPSDQHDRFLNSVTRGRNQMPPWGDVFSTDQIEALWAYVTAGERRYESE